MSESFNILVIDDDEMVRGFIRAVSEDNGWRMVEAENGITALEILKGSPDGFMIALLDIRMPGPSGLEILPDLLKHSEDLEVIMMSGFAEVHSAVEALQKGACDLIEKPIDHNLLVSRVQKALQLREVRRANRLYVKDMEEQVRRRTNELDAARKATIFGLARLAEYRDHETGYHLERMAHYAVALAGALRDLNLHRKTLDDLYIQNLYESAPLHDIGKVAIPDSILRKPDRLDEKEFEVIKTHSEIGARALGEIASQVEGDSFLALGIELTMSHHERWDGSGYPDSLAGDNIPLSARIVALADFYDALTFPRVYRPEAIPHDRVKQMIEKESGAHFDPDIVMAFRHTERRFTSVYADFGEPAA